MNWFYSKDGQQSGPVAFTEIERLYGAGELTADSLVWQQGMPNWVKLSTILATPSVSADAPSFPPAPVIPVAPVSSTIPGAPLPDYGDILCWGFLAVLVPCLGSLVYIALFVLNLIEYFSIRTAVKEGRLAASEYSNMNPVLFVLGLFCCGGLLYPLYMNYRNKSGYFKAQPKAVMIAIIVVILCLVEGGVTGVVQAMNAPHTTTQIDTP